jgi:hypothetical protein
MISELLKPREVDLVLRYPPGKSLRLAKKGLIPYIVLPDGEVRFREEDLRQLLAPGHREGQIDD